MEYGGRSHLGEILSESSHLFLKFQAKFALKTAATEYGTPPPILGATEYGTPTILKGNWPQQPNTVPPSNRMRYPPSNRIRYPLKISPENRLRKWMELNSISIRLEAWSL